MVDTPTRPAPKGQGVPLGTLVVFLYAVAVVAVFVGFAAYITRTEWESQIISNGSEVENLDNLIFLLQREEMLGRRIEEQERLVREADRLIDDAHEQVESLTEQLKSLNDGISLASRAIVTHIGMARPLVVDADRERIDTLLNTKNSDEAQADGAVLIISTLEFAVAADDLQGQEKIEKIREKIAQASDLLQQHRKDRYSVDEELRTASSARDRHLEARSPLIKRKMDLEAKLTSVQTQLPLDSIERAQFGALSGVAGGGLFLGFIKMPTIFLTLIVTIAAGSLGTLVSFSRSFRTGTWEDVRASRLFVSLGEGIAAAIAIFLFSGAGMLVLTQGAGPQKEVELSPYSVAFIAFLSGFMAEDAFAKIQEAGRNLFRPKQENGADDPPPSNPPASAKQEDADTNPAPGP